MGNLTDFIGGQHYTDSAGDTQHLNIEVVTALPVTPDPFTLYLITA